uniref:Basement membrane-specific heparan sulfate proteoglycan core protein n=1 Tax=Sparus aurata TaxID=8175 RepID=A0A671XHD0_SPAAU
VESWPNVLYLLLLSEDKVNMAPAIRLFPAVLNLASMADITANATCGSLGPEMFCKLVEHVPGQPVRNAQCRICNQKSTKPTERHPIDYAIDGTNRWWQSPSIKNGMEYHYVTITLDLKQVFQIAYVIIKAANSPRPGNWILERSIDGETFEPWQYYAITDTECLTRFNINPRTGPPSYTRDDEVICTSFYSKIHPLENGEIHTSLINGRPSADDPSPTLLNFTSARYIRLVFQRIRTLNADLMTLTLHDPRDIDPIVTRRYYYSIKDISVGGMCICYGHAKACPLNTLTKFSCECEHNTCGESCDRCCPGYHQQAWMAGTFHTRHICEKCNCHGKAEECYFNQTVAELSLSLDVHGQKRGGGVCIGCQENTAGINCETCVAGFYRPDGVSAEEEDPCIPCLCDAHGSISQSCVADSSQATQSQPAGSCRCKEGFGGPRCDRCAVGYMGYPSCQRCNCSVEGSINADPCVTPCVCKENVEGENCDRCKLGFYDLQGDNRRGCEKCSCMGVSSQCSASTWTYENTTLTGWHLVGDSGGRVWSVHRQTPPYLSVRHSDVMNDLGSAYYWNAPGLYLGNKGGGMKIIDRRFGQPVYPSSPSTNHIALLPENFLVSGSAQPISRRDFLSVLANVSRVMVRATYSTEPSAVYRLHSFTMQIANPSARGERRASAVEFCSCPPGYAGTSCEACIPGFRRVNGNLYNGVCEACHCHGHASQCHEVTGHCLDCFHHTTGSHCESCLPGYYGNATRGSPADCQPCTCPLNLPSNNFSPTCHLGEEGQLLCDQCQPGYTGPRCDRCSNGYFGQPSVPGSSCQPCDCNGNLDLSIPGSCDPVTGQCLRCRQGYGGPDCDSCAEGYYGDAITAKSCQPCQCHTNGSVSEVCNKETGQCQCRENVVGRQCDECMVSIFDRLCVPCHCNSFGSKSFDCDENGQCRCQPGVTGPKCDRCARGYFNFQEGGCTPCECSHVGDNCDASTGQCICPPNTIGERCDRCAPNHWGHDITTGCTECGCSVIGSVTQQCNVNTGCCFCRDSFRGEKCNECQIGYRDFPQCTQCKCSVSGSDSQTCDLERQVCACADRTGKCSCKVNVEGDNCDRCKPDTFGLSVRNPLGCSKCYCYGLTQSCTEAQGLIRMWLALKPEQTVLPLVDKSNTVESRRGVSFQHPEILAHAELVSSTLSEPYYWKLPEQFRGSMITAYGGQLKYAVYYEARDETGPSSYEPQVIIKGGPNRNVVMTRHIPGLQIGQLTRHEVDMTEHEWKYADGRSMTREDFMDILFYVDYILIKASHGNLMRHSRPHFQRNIITCFYRLRAGSLASVPASRVPTAAGMGSCVQCQCSGHSSTCDPETSICQNCQDNTEGDRCERCAPGFYGVVRGFHDDCKPCACPLTIPENNFSPTCVAEGFDNYRCTACPEGYEGKYCERCSTGYHGNPRMPGGRCEECKCSPWGALSGPCDQVTGQCPCRVGATGKSCDQCMDRHVSCDDECSGLLISDMDRLFRIITEVTLTTPLPPPYKVLYRFENMTDELKHMLSPQKAPERLLQLADSNLGSLVIEMDQLHSRATKVSADGEQVEDDADRIHKRAEDLEQFIRDTLLGLKAAELNQTLSRRDGAPDKSLKEMKEEIQAMLAEMRKRQLGGKKSIAEEEMDLAEELYQKVKRLFGDPHQATEDLKAEVIITPNLSSFVFDAQDLLYSAQGKTRQAGSLAEQNKANLTALERKRSAVSAVKQEAQEILGEGERLLEEANQLSDNIIKEIEDLEGMGNELGPLHDQLDDKVSRLTDGLSDGSLANHVHDAEEHAKQLNESAAILDGILAEAKNLSFNATAAFKAYSNIKANVDAAEKEAKAAKQRASEALALALGPDVPVKEAAQGALQKSHRLLNQAKGLQNDVKGNHKYTCVCTYNMLQTELFPEAEKLATTKAVAADANATAIDVLERLGDLNLQLNGLQRNYSELEDTVNTANQMIQDPEKNIHAAGAKVKDLEDEADRLLEKLQPIKKLQDNLRRNISQIKELINQARKQANSIKVSVSSGGDCLRSYRPDIRKGRYNTIILHVKTTTPDNLLFYLGSAKYVDFLALEMRKGKVNFLWDVGSGVGRVEYPHHTIHDGNWHRIEASRNGLNGTISVYPLEGSMAGMMPMPASANSPTAYTILDVDQNAYLFVGGILGTVKKADAVRTSTFTGCMGETFLDSKPIGLWNYRERQGDCKGCVVSPQRSDGEGIVQLDGEGYAAVGRPTRWNPNVSTVNFKFRTFSSESLLMYLATEDMKDFMSLELSEGKVKVNFDLGSGVGSAISDSRHNDGHWKSLTISRNKKQATVTVVDIDSGAEEKMVATSQGSATGLNLRENQRIYFGGLPTIGNYSMTARPEITLKRYAGCLREIEVSRTPYNLLSSSDYTGVTKGCYVENLHTVSFSKPGYMELGGLSLAVGTEISLSFSTLEDTGTILLAVGGASPVNPKKKTGSPYLSVMLNKGSLEVLVFTGSHSPRRVIRRPEQGTLNDGREHSLRIERLPGRSYAVQVDEEAKREAALPNDQPVNLQRIFLGGIPAEVEQTSSSANIPFQGCIWNLMVNNVLSDFSQPVSFENAEIGRCPYLGPPPPPLPLPTDKEEPEEEKEASKPLSPPPTPAPATPPPVLSNLQDSCASAVAPTALEKAYQFGLSRNSHMTFAFDDTKVRERLVLELELRTKEESGLVLYMARINHADFVCLGYDLGHGNISGCVPFSINDGNWHKIRVNRSKQRSILLVDGRYSKQMISPKKADLLDVVGVVYIGGLPKNYTTKRIGPVKHIDTHLHLSKCDFKLNMATPTSTHMVGRCFVATETGTYFDGTGFLKAVASYRVGLDVSIALEFRTSRTSGVLLAISNQANDGLGIEIVQGKLLFNVDNGAGRITAEHVPEGQGFCDGQWHSVTANKFRHRLELVVDGKQSKAESPNARSNTCDTNDPLYVGGYPDGVRQAAVSFTTSFRGCMKNLKITKASKTMDVHFNKALEIKGVQPLSCPAVAA